MGACCLGAFVFGSAHSPGDRHGREKPTPRHSTTNTSWPSRASARASEKDGATSNVYALDAHPGTSTVGSFFACVSPAPRAKSESSHMASGEVTHGVEKEGKCVTFDAGVYRRSATDQPESGTGRKCISSHPRRSCSRSASVSRTTCSGGGAAAAAAAARARSRRFAAHAPTP